MCRRRPRRTVHKGAGRGDAGVLGGYSRNFTLSVVCASTRRTPPTRRIVPLASVNPLAYVPLDQPQIFSSTADRWGLSTRGYTMQIKATALAAFLLLAGCNADNPTASLPASKHIEAEAEQCPIPLLGIVGTWAGSDSYRVDCPTCDNSFGGESIYTADTLSIGFAPDPYPPGEPGVTYYDYTLLSYYSPSTWDDPGLADLDLPSLYREVRGKMGVYYADGGTWAFNYIETYSRIWDEETKEYEEDRRLSWPRWNHEIKMFAGWLFLGHWNFDRSGTLSDERYKRVDE